MRVRVRVLVFVSCSCVCMRALSPPAYFSESTVVSVMRSMHTQEIPFNLVEKLVKLLAHQVRRGLRVNHACSLSCLCLSFFSLLLSPLSLSRYTTLSLSPPSLQYQHAKSGEKGSAAILVHDCRLSHFRLFIQFLF